MVDGGVIVRDPKSGLYGFRLEMGRDRNGARMQARRTGFVTEKTALVEYRRLSRQRDARTVRPRLTDTVETLCEDWLRAREQELQPNTVYNYTWLLSLIYPYLGTVRGSRLSARMTERAYRHLEAAGYSRTTLRTLDLVLTKAYGEQTGLTLGARRPRESDTLRPVWTLTEARRFLDHIHHDRLYPLWRLLLVTGLRRGELCGLQWRDLEPDLATLTVRRQRVVEDPASRVRDKPPKSHNSTRTLILDPATLKTLTATTVTAGSRYMFTGRTGQPLRPDNVTSRFNHLATRAGVRPIGPHQIRHLLACTYLDAGYGIHEVAERLGHDPGTLMRYYTRINATRRQQATEHIAQLLTEPPQKNDQPGAAAMISQGRYEPDPG
ncbi:site-specific integrase [Verrucosispora sp. WMMC514]|uniref:tyrosine-type recombinase/integrase n=1 Tax=Verrucosispora sp. WMMC514 TaxID=3015156 RepID=UPI00248CB3E0|nr:site-specific integrase [Verrucosispora sp. WMMC514]WBB89838.1 site-specific integrase [Verrucosispora sp. WMMC514]